REHDGERLGGFGRHRRQRRHRLARMRGVEAGEKAGKPGALQRGRRPDDAVEEIDLLRGKRRGLRDRRHAVQPAGSRWLTMARAISSVTPMPRLQPMSFFSTGSSGSTSALLSSSRMVDCDMVTPQLTSGGLTPAKNNQEISRPT